MIAAVCVKQVPMLIDLRLDTEAGRMVREGVRLQANPLDNIAALTTVVALAGVDNAEVVALSMGPPQSEAVLRHAIGLGADRGILICDPLLAGSDTLATARVLAAAIRRLGATLVVLGRHSIDAETGQTGAMVAGVLDWPVVSAVRALEMTPGGVRAERETDDGAQTVEAALPLVVTVADSAGRERWPSAGGSRAGRRRHGADLGRRRSRSQAGGGRIRRIADVGRRGPPDDQRPAPGHARQ